MSENKLEIYNTPQLFYKVSRFKCKCLICRQKPLIAQHVLKTLINV